MNEEEKLLYLDALEKAKEIALGVKNEDYNANINFSDYWIYGAKSIIHELHKKVLRLRSLESKGFKASCESAIDTCIDLINYAAFCYIYLNQLESE